MSREISEQRSHNGLRRGYTRTLSSNPTGREHNAALFVYFDFLTDGAKVGR